LNGLAIEAEQLAHAEASLAKRNSEPVRRFERSCDDMQKRASDRGKPISRVEAMRQAAREMSPEAFADLVCTD
jgi:hypothetical protein